MQEDGYFLHFLRVFPLWIVTGAMFVFLILLYQYTQDPVVKDLCMDAFSAFLTTLGIRLGQGLASTQTNVSEGKQTVINQPLEGNSDSSEASKSLDDIEPGEIDGLGDEFIEVENKNKVEEK
jgi:hypothetical protein